MTKDRVNCRIYFILQRKQIWRSKHMDKRKKRSPVLTVAGPMIVTPFLSAALISFRVRASGMPSAIMAMVRICIKIKKTISTPQRGHPEELCRTEKAKSCSQGMTSFWLLWGLWEVTLCTLRQESPAHGSTVCWDPHSSLHELCQRFFFSPPCTLEQHCILTNPT